MGRETQHEHDESLVSGEDFLRTWRLGPGESKGTGARKCH